MTKVKVISRQQVDAFNREVSQIVGNTVAMAAYSLKRGQERDRIKAVFQRAYDEMKGIADESNGSVQARD